MALGIKLHLDCIEKHEWQAMIFNKCNLIGGYKECRPDSLKGRESEKVIKLA
mgnify:CR=1 FL=1